MSDNNGDMVRYLFFHKFAIEDAVAVMNTYVVLFASMIPVSLTLLFIIMLLIVLVVLRCKKQQKVRYESCI